MSVFYLDLEWPQTNFKKTDIQVGISAWHASTTDIFVAASTTADEYTLFVDSSINVINVIIF